jgi:hypothetical protein
MLAYLSRYTHRVAISNSRLISLDKRGVTFRWKDYRAKEQARQKTMTLSADEFMRRFLFHVLSGGFQRIRHYGLLANGHRQENLTKVRALFNPQNALIVTPMDKTQVPHDPLAPKFVCAHCGAEMRIIDIFCADKLFARRHTRRVLHDCNRPAIVKTLSALSLARADARKLGPLVEKYPF